MQTKKFKILAVILSAVYIFLAGRVAAKPVHSYYAQDNTQMYKAVVTEILDDNYQKVLYRGFEGEDKVILFRFRFTNGIKQGITKNAVQYVDGIYSHVITPVKVGDKILVYTEPSSTVQGAEYIFNGYYRSGYLSALLVLFAVLLVILGRGKGINTLISLCYTVMAVFGVFIPAVLNGQNIYAWAVSTCIFIIVMTIIIVNGRTDKSLAAIMGCCTGVVISGALALGCGNLIHLTGMATEESMYLYLLSVEHPIDLRAVVFSAIIFGSVGAIMDVSMSLASSLNEVKRQAGGLSARQIFKSGINIGQDMMGTMANTLVLAYIGSSLGITLLTLCYNKAGLALFNSEMIVNEVLQAVAGSIGILLTIPITAAICALLYGENTTSID